MRTLALVVGVTNLSFTAKEAILVLFARQRLGLGAVGYGVLLTALAVGAFLGSLVVARLGRLLGPAGTLAAGLGLLALSRIGLAFTTAPVLAALALLVSGVAVPVFNVVGVPTRQRLVPDRLLGRVVSAYRRRRPGRHPARRCTRWTAGRARPTSGSRSPWAVSRSPSPWSRCFR